MEITDFSELVKHEVEKRTGDGYRVQLNSVAKNNGVVLNGITILQEGCNISPAIYLNDFYGAYRRGEATLGMIADNVMDLYGRNKCSGYINMDYLLDYESVKRRIVYRLINTEMNSALLENIPHVPFHDLSIVFEYLVPQQSMGSASILIYNKFMKIWDTGTEELYKAASINMPFLRKCVLKSMNEVIKSITGTAVFDIPMYVLSNTSETQGVACILYPNLLRDFARASQSDLFIIPSSVHECLILPDADPADGWQIKEIIREINETVLSAEEELSDNLYIYEQCTDKLRML